MESFRIEIENLIVQKEIIDLEKKIYLFCGGKIDDECFCSFCFVCGIYGQCQEGVQMICIKLLYGKVISEQLKRIINVFEEYFIGCLYIIMCQDIQIYYVSLDRILEFWVDLVKDDIILREVCGNIVCNIMGSELVGIDVNELFDVMFYVYGMF